MIIDAMDLLYTQKFDAFALVSSDSDFTKLASRLKESEIYVFGVGERKTPASFRNACDDFIFTENLKSEEELAKESKENTYDETLSEAANLMHQAWLKHQDEEGWVNVSVASQMLKRMHPDFDPRNYGVSKMSALLELLKDYLEVRKIPGKGTATLIEYRPIAQK
jgi:uncharacterized LabA/DUF88 family protein